MPLDMELALEDEALARPNAFMCRPLSWARRVWVVGGWGGGVDAARIRLAI